MAVLQEMKIKSKTKTAAIKKTSTEYSLLKKAIAPEWIIPSSSCISGVPFGCFFT
jgi:hypothetical protein